jgi:F420-non-reducing hydrogenase iron-sulfur subunit
MNDNFEPKIVAIFCYWCTTQAAELAGTSRMTYAPNVKIVKTMCTGRVDPQFILWAFRNGADGVIVSGCHPPSDCHYEDGNFKWFRKYVLLSKTLEQAGIDPKRLRQEWISASEADKLKKVITEFTEEIKALGPLKHPIREGGD